MSDSRFATAAVRQKVVLALMILSNLALVARCTSMVRDMSFDKLETEPGQKVVLFCSGENCKELTAVLEEIGAYPEFEFVRIDCATQENREKCAGAGFDKGEPRFFTNTAEAGIEPYSGENTATGVKDLLDFRSHPVTDSNVIYFENKEHLNALVEKGSVLVKFHQTWCGHCKTMKKHFEKASSSFPKDGRIHFVDIDCGEHGVSGYPTVKLLQAGGKEQKYEQARTFSAMVSFLKAIPVASDAAEL